VEAQYTTSDFQRLCAVGNCCCNISLKGRAHKTQAGLALLPCLDQAGGSISSEYFPFPVVRTAATTIPLSLKCENWVMPWPSRETRRKHSRVLGG